MSGNNPGFFSKLIGFFRIIIASALGVFLLFFVLFAGLGTVAMMEKEKKEMKLHSILHLDFKESITERTAPNPFAEFGLPNLDQKKSLGLYETKKAIRAAAKDKNIDGIYLDLSTFSSGFSTLQELHNLLKEFRQSGKFIVAYGEYIDEKTYLLASVATKVYLNPQGMLEFNGLSTERFYFTRLFQKMGVQPRIFKVGDFKSAVEPYFLERMSDADRTQTSAYLNSIYGVYIHNIAENRKMDKDSLRAISDNMRVQNASDAKKWKLVDDLFYYDEVLSELKTLTAASTIDNISFVKLSEYVATNTDIEHYSHDKIAVIVAEGQIVSGKGGADEIGSDVIAKAIREAREDEKIKGIVLRINSPGGSALASDVMWREVQMAAKVKPIVASMADVAASGGYYMAMGCNKIFAQPTTITGSIGIFGVLFDASDMLENKVGITFDRVSTGKMSDVGMPTKKFSASEELFFNKMVAEGYENFTTKAANGRKMELDSLKKVASGRVWSGEQAKKIGLIDEFGGLDEAIAEVAKMAKLTEYSIKMLPKQKNALEMLQEDGFGLMKQELFKNELGESYLYLKQVENVKKMHAVPQALMPYEVVIK